MPITRRKLILGTAALGAAGTTLRAGLAANTVPSAAKAFTVEDTKATLVQIYTSRGFHQATALPIISGHQFNDGLNYDDIIPSGIKPAFVVQPSARVEDVTKKDKLGTLPFFTILASSHATNASLAEQLKADIKLLVTDLGLKPQLLRITSTELIKPYLQLFVDAGITETQIRLRPLEQAKKAGDGSGWFAPVGHPAQPSYSTLSVEYQMPDGAELEIAEFGLSPTQSEAGGVGIGIGIERLTMARNDTYLNWNDYLPAFKQAVESDARDNKKKLPPGYYTILGQPQPA